MTIMARNSNAPARSKTSPQPKQTHTQRNKRSNLTEQTSRVIDASLKRRARLLITSSSIPPQTRSLIRYALEIKDPYLAQIVRRVWDGEVTIENLIAE
jgi:hypothetical protein